MNRFDSSLKKYEDIVNVTLSDYPPEPKAPLLIYGILCATTSFVAYARAPWYAYLIPVIGAGFALYYVRKFYSKRARDRSG